MPYKISFSIRYTVGEYYLGWFFQIVRCIQQNVDCMLNGLLILKLTELQHIL